MEHSDDLHGIGLVAVDNQVRINQEKLMPLVGEILAPMADSEIGKA